MQMMLAKGNSRPSGYALERLGAGRGFYIGTSKTTGLKNRHYKERRNSRRASFSVRVNFSNFSVTWAASP